MNLTDPTGKFPIHCQSMSTKALYETCVLNYFDLEPYDKNNLGFSVEGEQGCYEGPEKYRAPGYLEGASVQVGLGVLTVEYVFDFASMQSADFISIGAMEGSGSIISDNMYFGFIKGMKHSSEINIEDNYGGPFYVGSLGVNNNNPYVSIGVGIAPFVSTSDFAIWGNNFYFGAGIGEGAIDYSAGTINTHLLSGVVTSYIRADKRIDSGRLYSNILNGPVSPWWFVGNVINAILPVRTIAQIQANKYVIAYESLHEKAWLSLP